MSAQKEEEEKQGKTTIIERCEGVILCAIRGHTDTECVLMCKQSVITENKRE